MSPHAVMLQPQVSGNPLLKSIELLLAGRAALFENLGNTASLGRSQVSATQERRVEKLIATARELAAQLSGGDPLPTRVTNSDAFLTLWHLLNEKGGSPNVISEQAGGRDPATEATAIYLAHLLLRQLETPSRS